MKILFLQLVLKSFLTLIMTVFIVIFKFELLEWIQGPIFVPLRNLHGTQFSLITLHFICLNHLYSYLLFLGNFGLNSFIRLNFQLSVCCPWTFSLVWKSWIATVSFNYGFDINSFGIPFEFGFKFFLSLMLLAQC